jgi:hypothetical protein
MASLAFMVNLSWFISPPCPDEVIAMGRPGLCKYYWHTTCVIGAISSENALGAPKRRSRELAKSGSFSSFEPDEAGFKQSEDLMVNLGLVGLGYWGPNLLRNLVTNRRTGKVTICDRTGQT